MARARSRSPTPIAASSRSPSTLNRPGWRVPLASARVRGDRQLRVGRAVIAERERDEPEDVAVVDLEGQVAALDGQLEPLGGESSSLVGPAVMGRHQRHAAQPPGREDLGSLACVALASDLGVRPCRGPVAAKDLEAGQHHVVERVVAARPGLDPDEPFGHRDRQIEIVRLAGQAEGDAVGTVVLPRPSGLA